MLVWFGGLFMCSLSTFYALSVTDVLCFCSALSAGNHAFLGVIWVQDVGGSMSGARRMLLLVLFGCFVHIM